MVQLKHEHTSWAKRMVCVWSSMTFLHRRTLDMTTFSLILHYNTISTIIHRRVDPNFLGLGLGHTFNKELLFRGPEVFHLFSLELQFFFSFDNFSLSRSFGDCLFMCTGQLD